MIYPKYCTVKDMNYSGEVMRGEFDGTHYVLDDGDMYLWDTLADYGAEFSEEKYIFSEVAL